MNQLEPIDLSQNINNEMTRAAEVERAKLFPKNGYKDSDQYSSVNPNALADGDEKGRGTGGFLDVYNNQAGTLTDNVERTNNTKVNKFNNSKPYPDF